MKILHQILLIKKLCTKPREGRKKKKRDSAVQDYRRFL